MEDRAHPPTELELRPNIRSMSAVGENTEEPQMVREHASGPRLNILGLLHLGLLPRDAATKPLENVALLTGSYSGDLVF